MSPSEGTPTVEDRDGRMVVRVPMTFKRRGGRKEIIVPEGTRPRQKVEKEEPRPLVVAIARARIWLRHLESGQYPTVSALARALGIDRSYVSRVLRLALLAPDIIKAIFDGTESSRYSYRSLIYKIPRNWDEQRNQLVGEKQRGHQKTWRKIILGRPNKLYAD